LKSLSRFKSRVLQYLTSHVNSVTSVEARFILLNTVAGVKGAKKLSTLAPTFKDVVSGTLGESDAIRISRLLASTFDVLTVPEMNSSADLWTSVEEFFRWCFRQAGASSLRLSA
jgi:hypothetical protein